MARKPKAAAAAPLLDLDEMITEWFNLSEQVSKLIVHERELRTEIFKRAFPNPERGTNKIRISHGMALVGDYRLNYTVDRPLLEEKLADAKIAPIVHEIINFQPNVREGAFYKLSDEDRNLVADMITEKPGTPGLEIKSAAKVRW